MKRITVIVAAGLLALGMGPAVAQEGEAASNMQDLLNKIEQGKARDSQEARQRESRFAQQRNEQQNLLDQARAERTRQENESARLEGLFEENQQSIITARTALDERLGALKELFGVLQTVAGDAQGRFDQSLTNLQFPDRKEPLVALGAKMADANSLANIEDIEGLWFELQREIVESGKIVTFQHPVITAAGEQETIPLTRVGNFNLVGPAGYYEYNTDGSVSELPRQPEGRFTSSAIALASATGQGGVVDFGIDVTRGGILGLLVETPTLMDKFHEGGIVGYSIAALGAIGLLVALLRLLALSNDSRKVSAQLKRETASTDNPLGRVLAAYESNEGADTETIELKLSEAALKEMPGLTKGLLFIKVVGVVAPLMGLLGTVTGMIKTFQVITLYGAGDPKMMAGGISQALVTTVLGLVVAIPMVLLHTLVSGQSKKIINVLQSQSAGLVAQHSEKSH
jgi:biopolymer transport protein ExbB